MITPTQGIRYPETFRREVAEFASRTTRNNAARKYLVSPTSVRKWMRQFKLPGRRSGNLTDREFEKIAGQMVGMDRRCGPPLKRT